MKSPKRVRVARKEAIKVNSLRKISRENLRKENDASGEEVLKRKIKTILIRRPLGENEILVFAKRGIIKHKCPFKAIFSASGKI